MLPYFLVEKIGIKSSNFATFPIKDKTIIQWIGEAQMETIQKYAIRI